MRYRWLFVILLSPLVGICICTGAAMYVSTTKLAAWQTERSHQAGAPLAPTQTLQEHQTPPHTMRDVAQKIADISGPVQGQYQPVELIRIGEQDYLLLLAGTQLAARGGNDLHSAVQEVTQQSSSYIRHVDTLIREHIPHGSTIHLAGHSLGGMVANKLAIMPDILDDYTVKTVITFAAPVNACPNPAVVYHRYVVQGDLVPTLHRGAVWSRLKGPLDVLKSTCAEGYAYLDQTQIDHTPGPVGLENPHSSYEQSRDLVDEPLPFLVKRYESLGRFAAVSQANE